MYTEWPEDIVYLVIIREDFLREYCILLVKWMYKYVDAALLWLILLSKYLVNKCNLNKIKADSCIFFWKDKKGKLEIVISLHVDDVVMNGKPETLKVIKENIKEKFNIS